jgi:hypothetical protein
MNPNEPALQLTAEAKAIPPAYHAGVMIQLEALREQARLVETFPLPEELEPAAVFVP